MLIDRMAAFHLGVPAEVSIEELITAVLAAAMRHPADWGGDCSDLAEWLGCPESDAEPVFAAASAAKLARWEVRGG